MGACCYPPPLGDGGSTPLLYCSTGANLYLAEALLAWDERPCVRATQMTGTRQLKHVSGKDVGVQLQAANMSGSWSGIGGILTQHGPGAAPTLPWWHKVPGNGASGPKCALAKELWRQGLLMAATSLLCGAGLSAPPGHP